MQMHRSRFHWLMLTGVLGMLGAAALRAHFVDHTLRSDTMLYAVAAAIGATTGGYIWYFRSAEP
jgi:Mn2+/Fe2+ NRAMP family transporter